MKSTLSLSLILCWCYLLWYLSLRLFISQGKIQVNVPKASTAVAFKADELAKLLTVTADKQLYFNDRPITQEALEAEIAQWNKDQKSH